MRPLQSLAGLSLALVFAVGCTAPTVRTPLPAAVPPRPPAADLGATVQPPPSGPSDAERTRWSERLRAAVMEWEVPTYGAGSPALKAATVQLQAVLRPGVDPRALRASAMEVLGDTRRALADLRSLAAEDPPSPAAVCRYATLAVREGRGREAERFLSDCAERDAGNPELRGVLGWIFLALDEPGEARPHLEATWGTPVAERYAVFLARVRLLAGDLDGAVDAALLGTRNVEAAPIAWTLVGDAQRARGLAAPAEEAYRKALSVRPGDYAASVNLGVLRLGQGKAAEAEALFAVAAEARPGAPEAWTDLGLARQVQGNYRGAREALGKALAADPNCAPALKNLGIVNEKYLGRPADALPYYDRYLTVRPGDAEVERWRKAAARLAGGAGVP